MSLTKVTYSMINGAPANVLDFGGVMNDVTQGSVNAAALVNAWAAGKSVYVPAGTLTVAGPIEVPAGALLTGAGWGNTTIQGPGDIFQATGGVYTANPYFSDFTLKNITTNGNLITINTTQDTGAIQCERIYFSTCNTHYYADMPYALVGLQLRDCLFIGSTTYSKIIRSAFAYCEIGCSTNLCAAGLLIHSGIGNSIYGCIYQECNFSAIEVRVDNASSEMDGLLVSGTYFEVNGKVGSPSSGDVYLATTAAGRIRNVTFETCIFVTPSATQISRIQIVTGGGGNIANCSASSCTVGGSVPFVTDVSTFTANDCYYQVPASQIFVNVKQPELSFGSVGQLTPYSIPSSSWNTSYINSSITIANNATYDLATGSGLISFIGVGGDCAGVVLCALGTTTLVATTLATVSIAQGTAAKLNVYYNAGTAKYRLENLTGASTTISISMQQLRAIS
jgi:hypothetical protein